MHSLPRFSSFALLLACRVSVESAEPKRDRYGDPLPQGAIARLGSQRLRPQQPIYAAAFTPDSKYLATGGEWDEMGGVTFWGPFTGKDVWRLPLPLQVRGLRFKPDGKSLIVVGNAGLFRILDADSGATKWKLDPPHDSTLLAVDVARDGNTAVTTDLKGNIIVWDLVRGKRIRAFQVKCELLEWSPRIPFDPVAVLTPDGKQIVVPHDDRSLHLMDVATGAKVVSFEMSAPPAAVPPKLRTVAVSPDGRYLAYGCSDTPATLCDLKTGKILHTLTAPKSCIFGLLFMPDNRTLAVQADGEMRFFDLASGKETRKFAQASDIDHVLAVSPDGKMLALRGGEYALSLWNVGSGRRMHSALRHMGPVPSIVFFPDGKRLISSDVLGNLIVWDTASAQELAHCKLGRDEPHSLAVDADGKTVCFLTADRVFHRWHPTEGGKTSRQKLSRNLFDFVLSPDGRTVAATRIPTRTSQAQLLDLQSGKTSRKIALPVRMGLGCFLFSPDSRRLLIETRDDTLRLCDRDTGKLVRELKADNPWQGPLYRAIAGDGRSIASFALGSRTFMQIREIASGGRRLHVPCLPDGRAPLAYSADSRFLAYARSVGDIVVLGTATGELLELWQGPPVSICSLTFSPDSRLLASGGVNGTILLWKLPNGEDLPTKLKDDEAAALWQALAEDAAGANRALAGLAAASAQAVPLIRKRFRIEWKRSDAKQIARWIAELDDDSFQVRERATSELSGAGSDAGDALRQARENRPSAEAKRRIEGLLNRLEQGGDPERLRCLRALEVLERIGTPAAKDALRELAGKTLPAELDDEIRASLRRLGERH